MNPLEALKQKLKVKPTIEKRKPVEVILQIENKQIENRNKLMEYYLRSYKDDYLVPKQDEKYSIIEEPEKRDDDVEDHYKYMFINPPPKPTIDYDELDKQYALKLQLEEDEKAKEKNDIYCEYSDEYDEYEIDYDYS